jgi:hypothetical protein
MTTRKLPPAVSRTNTAASRTATIGPRRYLRAAVSLPAQYALDGDADWNACMIDNLGGGGVRIQTEADLAAGTIIALRFIVDALQITATGRIAMSLFDRSRACFIHGVAFTAIHPEMQEALVRRVVTLATPEHS